MLSIKQYDSIAEIICSYICDEKDSKELEEIQNDISGLFCSIAHPSGPPECSAIFWKDRECWWKPFVEIDCHKFGQWVFDQGLHKGDVEPGFYRSLLNAACYGLLHIDDHEGITVKFYKELNRIAIAHFDGNFARNGTVVPASEGGKFSRASGHSRLYGKENHENSPACPFGSWSHNNLKEHCKRVNKAIQDISNEYGLEQVANLNVSDGEITIDYLCPKEKLEGAVVGVFKAFNSATKFSLKRKVSLQEHVYQIAYLFQFLEWVHCFGDGQGRTDLLLFNLLLCKYVKKTVSFEYPYFSSFNTFHDWHQYALQNLQLLVKRA